MPPRRVGVLSSAPSRIAAALGLAIVLLGAGAAPAVAIDIPDLPVIGETPLEQAIQKACVPDVPGVQRPDQGVAARLSGGRPDVLPPQSPVTSVPTIAEFGYAGLEANVYDTGCAPGDGFAVETRNWVANRITAAGVAFTALTEGVERNVHDPEWMGQLRPIVEQASSRLGDQVFRRWVGVAFLAVAIVMAWKVGRQNLRETADQGLWAVVAALGAIVFLAYPLAVAEGAQKAMTAVMSEVYRADMTGDVDSVEGMAAAASQNTYETVHYPGWLRRTFGTADSPVAQEYGPLLFRASTLSWAQVDTCNASPAQCKAITERHAGVYRSIMERIEVQHPETYKALQGENGSRPDEALFEGLAAFTAGWLRLASAAVVGSALIVLVLLGIVFPVAALIAMFPRMEWVGKGLLNAGAAAAVFGVVLGVTSWLATILAGALLDPQFGLDPVAGLLLLLAFTVILWIMTRPVKRLISILSLGAVSKYGIQGKRSAGVVGKATKKYTFGVAGLVPSRQSSQAPQPQDMPGPPEAPSRRESFVAPPPPPPPPQPQPTAVSQPGLPAEPTHKIYHPTDASPRRPAGSVSSGPAPTPSGHGTYQRGEGARPTGRFAPTYLDDGGIVYEVYQRATGTAASDAT